jgi:glycosyltransferase involved in cell wall biosynthesis
VGSENGKLYPRKNIEGIIDSFLRCARQMPEPLKLVLVGKSVRETLARVYGEDFVKNDSFVFPGYVPQEFMPAVYNLAELLVFPSYYESFGIPLVEAMACGCPIVASNTGACPEIVGDAGLTRDPGDAEALARAMIDVLGDAAMADRLRQAGLRRAQHFSWEKSAMALKSAFAEAATARVALAGTPTVGGRRP